MVVSQNGGTHNIDPQNTIVLIIRTAKKVPLILGNPQCVLRVPGYLRCGEILGRKEPTVIGYILGLYWGLYWDNGKENGNYRGYIGIIGNIFLSGFSFPPPHPLKRFRG